MDANPKYTLLCAICLASSCSFDWDAFVPNGEPSGAGGTPAGVVTTSSTGGSAGRGGAGGGATGGGDTGGNGDGGFGGAGGMTPALVGRGLVARYYIDEEDTGQGAEALRDRGPAPAVDLPIDYVAGMTYSEIATGRGLTFPSAPHTGFASAAIDGTKLRSLVEGNTEATLEIVFDAVAPVADGAIVMQIMEQGMNDGRLGFLIFSGFPGLELNDTTQGIVDVNAMWDIDVVGANRAVAHFVVDTTLGTQDERAKLFVDGVLVGHHMAPPVMLTPIVADEPVTLVDNCRLIFGNRVEGDRYLGGTIFYGAVYNVALSALEIANNTTILALNDDRP